MFRKLGKTRGGHRTCNDIFSLLAANTLAPLEKNSYKQTLVDGALLIHKFRNMGKNSNTMYTCERGIVSISLLWSGERRYSIHNCQTYPTQTQLAATNSASTEGVSASRKKTTNAIWPNYYGGGQLTLRGRLPGGPGDSTLQVFKVSPINEI